MMECKELNIEDFYDKGNLEVVNPLSIQYIDKNDQYRDAYFQNLTSYLLDKDSRINQTARKIKRKDYVELVNRLDEVINIIDCPVGKFDDFRTSKVIAYIADIYDPKKIDNSALRINNDEQRKRILEQENLIKELKDLINELSKELNRRSFQRVFFVFSLIGLGISAYFLGISIVKGGVILNPFNLTIATGAFILMNIMSIIVGKTRK